MRVLASYMMRGRWQAILATVGLGAGAQILLPLIFLSVAAVALVTLVQGAKEGLLNVAGATVLVVLAGVLSGQPLQWDVTIWWLPIWWLPAWGLALVLSRYHSLALTVGFNSVVCGVLLSVFYLLVDDPAGYWYSYINEQMLPILKEIGMQLPPDKELQPALHRISEQFTGGLASWISFVWVISLFIARWWQSALYRPGAYGEEFRHLFLGLPAAIAAMGLIVLGQLGDGQVAQWSQNLFFVLLVPFMLQGLAVGHAIVKMMRANPVWLITLYVFLLFAPGGLLLVALLGLLDNGINIRARIRPAQG